MAKQIRCYVCEELLSKNEVGLNKKLLGNCTGRNLCLSCFASHLDTTIEDLLEKIEDFKNEGCTLFE